MFQDRDTLKICHAYLNALHASLQGRYALLNVLTLLHASNRYTGELEDTAATIEHLSSWMSDLWVGEPLDFCAHETDLLPDAREALDLFEQVRRELKDRAVTATGIVARGRGDARYHDIVLLVAFRAYQAYAKEHYVRNLVAYGEIFGPAGAAERWRSGLPGCDRDIRRVHALLDEFVEEEELRDEVVRRVYDESLLVPAIFRAQLHDLNQISAFQHERFTFALAEFLPNEWSIWQKFKLSPREAGYWRAYDIPPQEVEIWKAHNFSHPEDAALWRYRGFSPSDAEKWYRAGFTSNSASHYLRLGCEEPLHARTYFES